MKHLKLGCYSFTINVDELGLAAGTSKDFTRDELPDDLKPLFDIVYNSNEHACSKSIFVNVIDKTNKLYYSGFLVQNSAIFSLDHSDGGLLTIQYVNDRFSIIYYEI